MKATFIQERIIEKFIISEFVQGLSSTYKCNFLGADNKQ